MRNILIVLLTLITGTAFGQCYYQVTFPFMGWPTVKACQAIPESPLPITSACAAPRAIKGEVPEKPAEEPDITVPLPSPSVVPPMLRCPTGRCPLMMTPRHVIKRVEAYSMGELHRDLVALD